MLWHATFYHEVGTVQYLNLHWSCWNVAQMKEQIWILEYWISTDLDNIAWCSDIHLTAVLDGTRPLTSFLFLFLAVVFTLASSGLSTTMA